MSVNERIQLILKEKRIKDKDLAGWLGISAGRLSQKFKDGVWDSLAELKIISESTGATVEWLAHGIGSMFDKGTIANEPAPHYVNKEKELLLSKVDEQARTIAAMEKTIEALEKLNKELTGQLDELRRIKK